MKNIFIAFALAALLSFPAYAVTTSGTTAQITQPKDGGSGSDLSATGGASQVLKQSSVGGAVTVGRLSCAELSNGATSCSVDATNASNLTSGTIATARLGTGTANSTKVLLGDGSWADPPLPVLSCSDISNAAASCSTDATNANNITSGTVPTARLGSGGASSSTWLRGDQTWASAPSAGSGLSSCWTESASTSGYTGTATCSSGYLMSGGCYGTSSGVNMSFSRSYPSSSTTWTCYTSGYSNPQITAYVRCCS